MDNETKVELSQEVESAKIGANRQPDGTFGPGNIANPDGRPLTTPEEKIIKKATKELIREYKEKLAEALPFIEPKLVALAISGDMQAIKELHDRVMGKPDQKSELDVKGGLDLISILKKADEPTSGTNQTLPPESN